MKISASKQRMCIGGWFLAALVLVGLNASQFMSLEEQPLVGYSPAIKLVQTKLQDFDKTVATGIFAMKDRIHLIGAGARYPADSQAAHNPGAGRTRMGTPIPEAAEIALPKLSGIMQALDPRGAVYYRAVLNGRVCGVRDKIDEYTVVKISPTAVVIRHAGYNWTLDSPVPYFSSDLGD